MASTSKDGFKKENIEAKGVWWSIPQTLTWVMHRNSAAIDMIPLETTPFDVLIDFIGKESDSGNRSQRLSSTLIMRDDFLAKVKSGKLVVWGARSVDGPMQVISAADWLSIEALSGNNQNFSSDALGGNYDDEPRFYRSAILRDDVVALWPPHTKKHNSKIEIQRIIEEEIALKGGRLSIVEIDTLEMKNRTENSTVPQREKFREMQISIVGQGQRGRKPKN